MKRSFVIATVLAISMGAVWAQSDPIATRKATMKKTGGAGADVTKMIKGEAPFDLKTVQATLKTIGETAKVMPTLFPDTAKTGGETRALPKIWEDRADFDARWVKLGKDADAASAKITDEASLKVAFGDVTKNCDNCHDTYRARRN